MNVPTEKECFRMMSALGMLDHIAAHSLMVSEVARLLADGLRRGGVALDPKLVRAASLLHDVTKTRSLTSGENHAASGEAYLRAEGFPEVADIVGQHVQLRDRPEGAPPTEADVVNYADKRVLHEKVVTLEERMTYILERYGRHPDARGRLHRIWDQTRLREAVIFERLSFAPDELVTMIRPETLSGRLGSYRRTIAGRRHPSTRVPAR